MRGFSIFLIFTSLTVVITLALLIVGLIWLAHTPLNTSLLASDKVQSMAAAVGLVLGTAATLGGAIASIRVADLGLGVSQRQERSEGMAFLEERFSRAAEIYSTVLLELSTVSAAGVALDHQVPHFDRQRLQMDDDHLKQIMSSPVGSSLAAEFDYLDESLAAATAALRELARDDFTSYCFNRHMMSAEGKLDALNRKLVAAGVDEDSLQISIRDIPDVITIFEVVRRRLRNRDLGSVLSARLYANSADIDLFNVGYDNAAVRNFMFLGNLLFSRTGSLGDGRLFIANVGAAIMCDLARCVPDGPAIRAALAERYPDLAPLLSSMRSDFEPKNVVSNHLAHAISTADSIGDLYLLVSVQPPADPDTSPARSPQGAASGEADSNA